MPVYGRNRAFTVLAAACIPLLWACKKPCNCPADEPAAKAADTSSARGNQKAVLPSPFKVPEKYAEMIGEYRKTWTSLTGFEFSGLHWNQYIFLYVNKKADTYVKNYLEYVRLYVNQDIEESEDEEETHFQPYEVGTVFLKENFQQQDAKPGSPLTITLMIKKEKGYDPGANDWHFVQFDANGNIFFDGNSKDAPTQAACIKCHANMADRDFVFSTFCSIAPDVSK